jgi:hypothetical protein
MTYLVCQSWIFLISLDVRMRLNPLGAIYKMVRQEAIRQMSSVERTSLEVVCTAVDIACVLYFKKVLCFQRSVVTTLLLRRYGWPAQMVTGTQVLLPESHAWVEVDGNVVNDKPYVSEIYQVVDRS